MDIHGIGNALVDTEIQVKPSDLKALGLEKGLMTLIDENKRHAIEDYFTSHSKNQACGGSAANTILTATHCGARCSYSFRVGNDETGELFVSDFKTHGVHTQEQDRPAGETGRCLVLVTEDADRTMATHLGVSAQFSALDLDETSIENASWLYIEGYLVTSETGVEAAIKARQVAEQHDTKIAITLSDPGIVSFFSQQFQTIVGSGVDLLFCNEEEALAFTETESIDAAIIALKRIAKTFVITLGPKGAIVYDGLRVHSIPGTPVKAIDTNGAGDCFAGVFLGSLVQGDSYEASGQKAAKAAAKLVTQFGPRLSAQDIQVYTPS